MYNYNNLFYDALRIRMVEEKISEIYFSDVIQSPIHLSIGQEHASVGVLNALQKEDLVFSTYRGHANYLAKGGCLRKLMAELFGKIDGFAKGKAGSMHLASKEHGVMGSSAVVASTLSHSVGAAYALKYKKTGSIATVFFGEGATGSGVYHETLNLASTFKVPLLFICEFNNLAIFTNFKDVHSYDIKNHAQSYGIESFRINDGWDLEKINKKTCSLVEEIRKDSKPRMLIIDTCRYMQHVGPGEENQLNNIDNEKIKVWKTKDPLIVDKVLINKFAREISIEIEEAIEYAKNSDFPPESEVLTDVY